MGCSNSKTNSVNAIRRIRVDPKIRLEDLKEHYSKVDVFLPDRIKELYQRAFLNQFSVASSIDLKFTILNPLVLNSLTLLLPIFTEIRSLNLWKTRLGNSGCVAISSILYNFPHLNFLSVADNRISFEGLSALFSQFPYINELEHIDLHVNIFDIEATEVLAKRIGELKKIRVISIDDCELTGVGLKGILAAIAECKEIESVSVKYNNLGDMSGAVLIEALGKMKKLKKFLALQARIEAKAQSEVKQAFPNIEFSF